MCRRYAFYAEPAARADSAGLRAYAEWLAAELDAAKKRIAGLDAPEG
jgi:hypothetical protein